MVAGESDALSWGDAAVCWGCNFYKVRGFSLEKEVPQSDLSAGRYY